MNPTDGTILAVWKSAVLRVWCASPSKYLTDILKRLGWPR
jgi:hypothetical protein